jgi:hypothetical protein
MSGAGPMAFAALLGAAPPPIDGPAGAVQTLPATSA